MYRIIFMFSFVMVLFPGCAWDLEFRSPEPKPRPELPSFVEFDFEEDIVPDEVEDIVPDEVEDIVPDEVEDVVPDEVEDVVPDEVEDPCSLCEAWQDCCDGVCTDLTNDPENCGQCGEVCGDGHTCQDAECGCGDGDPCEAGLSCCFGGTDWSCVDTETDLLHCGACEAPCPSDLPLCDQGACYCTCGDGIYDVGEELFCPQDFNYVATEGDGYCDRTVEFADSPDCINFNYTCGDNTCNPSDGEHLLNCSDCGYNSACGFDGDGDGDLCDSWQENCTNCPDDCGSHPLCQTTCGN